MANNNSRALELNDASEFKENRQEHERLCTVTAFFVFGTLCYATYSLIIAGAQDILAGTFIQTSMVLVAGVGPNLLVNLFGPYFMQKIPYFVRIILVYLADISGLLILALVKQIHWKLIGVGLVSFGFGAGQMTFLALSSFYHETVSTAFSAGTGVGFVMASLYYTGMSRSIDVYYMCQ